MLQLLRHGSHLGLTNIFGETAVQNVLPSTLQQFFDSCVLINGEQEASRDLAVTFHYASLAPPNRRSPVECVTLLDGDDVQITNSKGMLIK